MDNPFSETIAEIWHSQSPYKYFFIWSYVLNYFMGYNFFDKSDFTADGKVFFELFAPLLMAGVSFLPLTVMSSLFGESANIQWMENDSAGSFLRIDKYWRALLYVLMCNTMIYGIYSVLVTLHIEWLVYLL